MERGKIWRNGYAACGCISRPKDYLSLSYEIRNFCDLVKTNGAETLLAYRDDFYAGYPALTKNVFGEGEAYYVCADFEQAFYDDFCRKLAEEKGLERAAAEIPEGLDVATREDEKYKYLFVQNYGAEPLHFRWIRKHTSDDGRV